MSARTISRARRWSVFPRGQVQGWPRLFDRSARRHNGHVTSAKPTFLVAAPSLSCPFFGHSVVLLVDHDDEGSFGFVVNKGSVLKLPEILTELGKVPGKRAEDVDVIRGGPVSPETGWVIFDPRDCDSLPGDVMVLSDHLAVTASVEMLDAIAADRGPKRAVLALGYAGWGPGQLEDELREGSWLPMDVDLEVLFSVEYEERWERALSDLGIEPWRVVPRGSAQA